MKMASVSIDGRDVIVPAGTGLVEATAKLGIEIPVFCYEPRIGPAVGACRMCLVEIEGMPKLQTACSTPVRDGMVVSTAGSKARDAQEAVLEFLLLNHPLDCPVCDKGGECPLQNQAYRWGAGVSRFDELKRNNDKPIPVSPLIALDRERCILCYRCTRFSSEVSQDHQLVARERGASSVIATFEGQPYAGHFSGNIVELCPVGALTSTEFRFKGRPWESPDHPSVCGSCAVGCNTYATVREGRVIRTLARENAAVDDGWLCDRGRFSYPALYAPERITAWSEVTYRDRPAGNRPSVTVSQEGALEWLHSQLTAADAPSATWVLSGTETLEEAYAMQQIAARTGGRVVALGGGSAGGPAAGATLADLAAATEIVIATDADLTDVAPITDLRVRKALRDGANVTVAGIGGTRLEPGGADHVFVAPGALDAFARDLATGGGELADLTARLTTAERVVVVVRDGELGEDAAAALSAALGLGADGSGILSIAATANARGLAALGIEPVSVGSLAEHRGGIILSSVIAEHHAPDDVWGPLLAKARFVVALAMFPSVLTHRADLVIPASAHAEKDGTLVNLEGRLQRVTVGAPAPEGVRSELSWLSGLARRVGASVPAFAAGTYRLLAAAHGPRFAAAPTHAEIVPDGVLIGAAGGVTALSRVVDGPAIGMDELSLYVAPFLYDAPEVRAAPRMEFLRDDAWLTIARADADRIGIGRGDSVSFVLDGVTQTARVAVSRRLTAGHARIHAGTASLGARSTGFHAISPARVAAPVSTPQSAGASI